MNNWNFYTSKEIKPEGWLRRQLEIQANGLSGNLDKVWRDVKDSAWIGGTAEGWERVPYWLDGFIPLAYLLEDEDMIARAKKYIDAILSYQKPSGWICPCTDEEIPTYDTWAIQLISKVLVVYYECSGDERIPDVIYSVLKNYYELLSSGQISLFGWGQRRWFETFIAIRFLQRRTNEDWVLSLAEILRAQGTDFTAHSHKWKRYLNQWTQETHIVNLAMMLKYEALVCSVLGIEYTNKAEELVSILREYNGTPVGLFTGDECLGGLSPIHGTELCAVAEQMYSYEWLYTCTGDDKWAERLEVLAFNALPATISDDMWAHQYVQLSNQMACVRFPGKPIFTTNGKEAHMFGLEPNYGCCTANFNQAWPKLTLSAFMHADGKDGITTVKSVVFVPSTLKADGVSVRLETNYPFENTLRYTVSTEKALRFTVRIPSFAEDLKVGGAPVMKCGELSFDISAGDSTVIEISFSVTPHLIDRPYSLKSVVCGSLVFSVPVSYEKKMYEFTRKEVERKFPYCDYEYYPTSEWSFALSSTTLERCEREVSDVPFSSDTPPVVIKARVRPISWGLEDGYEWVCAKEPASRTPLGEEREIELYPYGCAKLRMTELPLI